MREMGLCVLYSIGPIIAGDNGGSAVMIKSKQMLMDEADIITIIASGVLLVLFNLCLLLNLSADFESARNMGKSIQL
jgi:hypothetical protein